MLLGRFDGAERAFKRALEFSQSPVVLRHAQEGLQVIASVRDGKLNARHILVKTEQEALEILSRLKANEDFAKLAWEHSIDQASKGNGGSLGFFSQGDLYPAFEEAVLRLEVGETSGVVETPLGYHIILRVN